MNAEAPPFLRQPQQRQDAPSLPPIDLAAATSQFAQFHKVASKRDGFVDADTKLIVISNELQIIFSLLTNALRGREH